MRLKPLVILLFLFLFSKTIQGQYIPMVEEGKYWIYLNYYISGDDFLSVSGHAITFQGDTVVNSVNYKKVFRLNLKGYHNCPWPPCWQFTYPYQTESKELIAFIREDTLSKKVYTLPLPLYSFCDTTEHLIFDYSLAVGDTVNSCIYDFIQASSVFETTGGIVDSIGERTIFGKNRYTIFTTGFLPYPGEDWATGTNLILEGVGLDCCGIFFNPLSAFVDFCEGGLYPCQLLSSNSDIESPKSLNIFPNPTKGIIQVSPGGEALKSIRVYSAMGVLQNEFFNTHKIDLGNLDSGVYFLELTMDNHQRMVTTIIKEN